MLLFSPLVLSDSLQPHELQHARLPCSSPSHRVCSYSWPLSRWCHPTISSSVVSSLPAFSLSQHQGSFPMSWLFTSGGQSIGASASATVLAMNIQGSFPLGLTGWISLESKGLSRESSLAPQFDGISSSVLSLFYCTALTSVHDYWKNHSFDYVDLCRQNNVSAF